MHEKLLKISVYAMIINIFLTPISNTLAIPFGYLSIISNILYPVLRTSTKKVLRLPLFVFYFLVVAFVSIATSISAFSTNNLSNYLVSLLSFLAFYWSMSLRYDEKCQYDICFLFRANYILCFLLILYSFAPFDFKYTVLNQWGDSIFTMGLGNPNAVSVYVMFSEILLIIHLFSVRQPNRKILICLLIVALQYTLFKLSSRTAFFCTLLLILIVLIRLPKKIRKWVILLVICIPVVMILIQFVLSYSRIDIRLLGKSMLTGRSDMYKAVFNDFINHPFQFIFGSFFAYPLSNLHNAPLSVFASLGIVGFLVYWLFWYRQLNYLRGICIEKIQIVAFLSLLVFVIHSSSEAMLMIGTIPYSMIVHIIYLIAKGELK